ncbi:DMT family transporter [Caproiciproducens sp. NJN-50]|uniref:DMT family transporter n=1 Tax=Acutalibacteraceae TaxID=3082771 RepID=UPI000FFE03C2|nr:MULTISPECIES: DMT family transporter [Acutalibacteraceae]QAT48663.1 DMT family transporter [Caproiciproducens sp. NJN-50]
MTHSKAFYGNLTAILTILIWGTTFISTKILLRSFTPIEILLMRFLLGYAALWLMRPRWFSIKPLRQEILFLLAGLCGVTLYYLFENIALTYTLAANVGVIVSISPFFTALLAHFLLKGEKLRVPFLIGFLTAILGISLIDFNGGFVLKINPFGDFLALCAAAVWAAYSILMKKISNFQYPTIECTRRVFFYGILLMIPAACAFGVHVEIKEMFTRVNLFNLLFLGLGASALCFVTWNLAVNALGVVRTSIYIYLVPVITITASALILRERITWIEIVGAAFTMAGLFVSMAGSREKVPELPLNSRGTSL